MKLQDAQIFEPMVESLAWVEAADRCACEILADPQKQQENLRHGRTWFVGVDALPNGADGSIEGVPLRGAWEGYILELPQHRAQLSVIYPGYPARDADQSQANHGYRVTRMAAHVDGLLPEGPERRRFAREFHAYILGVQLSDCTRAPTVYWPGSHVIMGDAIRAAIGDRDPAEVDLTDVYQAARRAVFEQCDPVPLEMVRGGAFLLHRFTLHGTAPWSGSEDPMGRRVAFFRPEFQEPAEWLAPD